MSKVKNQDKIFNFRYNARVQSALEKLAEFHGLSCSSYLRMSILRDVKEIETHKA
jgi:hypothetical protein